jgi:hypothetical protein
MLGCEVTDADEPCDDMLSCYRQHYRTQLRVRDDLTVIHQIAVHTANMLIVHRSPL